MKTQKTKEKTISALITVILPLIISLILAKVTDIEQCISKHPFISLALNMLFLSILLCYYIYRAKEGITLNNIENEDRTLKRYSIVLVEDDPDSRAHLNGMLKNYDICAIQKVDNAKLLYGFDIIVLDIMNASSIGNSSIPIIKELYHSEPYKYVIAISKSKTILSECKALVNAIVEKDESFDINLKDEIKKAFKKLDKPQQYWNDVETKINNDKLKDIHKKDYYYNLLQKSNFKIKD